MKGTLTDRVVLPRSPMAALPEEVETVVDYAKAQPREECRRLAGMMVDGDIAHLTPSTVYRILDRCDLRYRWKRPEPDYGKRTPEATYPNDLHLITGFSTQMPATARPG